MKPRQVPVHFEPPVSTVYYVGSLFIRQMCCVKSNIKIKRENWCEIPNTHLPLVLLSLRSTEVITILCTDWILLTVTHTRNLVKLHLVSLFIGFPIMPWCRARLRARDGEMILFIIRTLHPGNPVWCFLICCSSVLGD